MNLAAAVGVFTPFIGGTIGSYITRQNLKTWYATKVVKPKFTPPNWVFGPAWTTLYASMGYASYLVWKDGGGFGGDAQLPLIAYGTQLSFNWAYTVILFGKKDFKMALLDILLLDVGIVTTIYQFSKVNETASYLLYPYLAWCLFATYLSKGLYDKNKGTKHLE